MIKTLLVLPVFLAALSAQGQTTVTSTTTGVALTPTGPTATTTPGLTPATPITIPAFTNLLAPYLTNVLAPGVVGGDLGPLLLNLENSLLNTLPTLSAFNDGFELTPVGGGAASASAATVSGSGLVSATPGVMGTANGTTAFRATTVPATGLSSTAAIQPALGGGNPVLGATTTTPAGVTTTITAVATNNIALPGGFAGLFGTNTFGLMNTRDALRALLVLQADIERMIPIVDALNGANLGASLTNTSLTMPTLGGSAGP
ncbi:MAG TPA: hypothetical protein VHH88_11470 [Verrucomicrobiae bacterium]|nr:hypothetical protein [Verrucomicrobiae bacterium]